jgi:hypothetical protein
LGMSDGPHIIHWSRQPQQQLIFGYAQSAAVSEAEIRVSFRMLSVHPSLCLVLSGQRTRAMNLRFQCTCMSWKWLPSLSCRLRGCSTTSWLSMPSADPNCSQLSCGCFGSPLGRSCGMIFPMICSRTHDPSGITCDKWFLV